MTESFAGVRGTLRNWLAGFLLVLGCMACLAGGRAEEGAIALRLIPTSRVQFTNAIPHYVYFDAEVENAEKLTVKLYSPSGAQSRFRTRQHVDKKKSPVRQTVYTLRRGQKAQEEINILFVSEIDPGIWKIEVTASGKKGSQSVTEILEIQVDVPAPLELGQLGEVHAILDGEGSNEPVPVQEGKIRFVAQNPKDHAFVDSYWLSKAYDLRDCANQKCSRAVFSMALSYLGIDMTPVRMSEILWGENIFYTFDPVCEKLGNVERVNGSLEDLWDDYEQGNASPVLVHFRYNGGEGMHALLLVSRDRLNPDLYYCVTSSTPVNTSAFPDGREKEHVLPILIEDGRIGQRIQSPMLNIYHKGQIDEIWQWRRTDIP
ncbi:MAG: hypothetical protein IKE24_03460 [Clostridia bacterium]|nr:hypothetical protein [Clostridia bacterium]